jgi:hypothetical protein
MAFLIRVIRLYGWYVATGDGVRLITRGRDLATLVADALVEESVRPQTRTLSSGPLTQADGHWCATLRTRRIVINAPSLDSVCRPSRPLEQRPDGLRQLLSLERLQQHRDTVICQGGFKESRRRGAKSGNAEQR